MKIFIFSFESIKILEECEFILEAKEFIFHNSVIHMMIQELCEFYLSWITCISRIIGSVVLFGFLDGHYTAIRCDQYG